MYLTTEKRAVQVQYFYVVLALLLIWGVYLNVYEAAWGRKESLLLIFPVGALLFMMLRGKYILEMDTDSSELIVSNRTALFNKSVPFFRQDIRIPKDRFLGFWIENHVVVRRLFIRYLDKKGVEKTSSFSLSSLYSEDVKAMKASLGRITVQNKKRSKVQIA
ncbi:MAG: hypothetical protein LAT76_01205 [Schleiferiaceae bacterium]|nr:hypothetical protein [Schleiferiaceae bacterium]